MMDPRNVAVAQLTALLVAPGRELARQLAESPGIVRAFQVMAELKTYPTAQLLEMRLRQLQPDLLLLDVATDLEKAAELIQHVSAAIPGMHVVGLHTTNDSEAIVRSLRAGASEFLAAPFDPATVEQALVRLRRLLGPQSSGPRELGKVVLFSSAKPGSGASTLAAQVAFALRRSTGKSVLLADLDLMGGSIGFYTRVPAHGSLLQAFSDDTSGPDWPSLVTVSVGVHVLPAPRVPDKDGIEPTHLHVFLEQARKLYDWVVLDVPSIFHRVSLLALSESDQAFLVSTAELPSLHLARKAVKLLAGLGFGKERYQVVVNRVDRKDGLTESDVEKIFNCSVGGSLPNDYAALDHALTGGEALDEKSDLGRAVSDLVEKLAGAPAAEKKRTAVLMQPRPVFSQS